jgi:hypothetical protein
MLDDIEGQDQLVDAMGELDTSIRELRTLAFEIFFDCSSRLSLAGSALRCKESRRFFPSTTR